MDQSTTSWVFFNLDLETKNKADKMCSDNLIDPINSKTNIDLKQKPKEKLHISFITVETDESIHQWVQSKVFDLSKLMFDHKLSFQKLGVKLLGANQEFVVVELQEASGLMALFRYNFKQIIEERCGTNPVCVSKGQFYKGDHLTYDAWIYFSPEGKEIRLRQDEYELADICHISLTNKNKQIQPNLGSVKSIINSFNERMFSNSYDIQVVEQTFTYVKRGNSSSMSSGLPQNKSQKFLHNLRLFQGNTCLGQIVDPNSEHIQSLMQKLGLNRYDYQPELKNGNLRINCKNQIQLDTLSRARKQGTTYIIDLNFGLNIHFKHSE